MKLIKRFTIIQLIVSDQEFIRERNNSFKKKEMRKKEKKIRDSNNTFK